MFDRALANAARVASSSSASTPFTAPSAVESTAVGGVARGPFQQALIELMVHGEVRAAHFRALLGAGALRAVGFGAKELLALGYDETELRGGRFSASELRSTCGYGAAALRALGYTPAELRAAGFDARTLKGLGHIATELRAAAVSSWSA